MRKKRDENNCGQKTDRIGQVAGEKQEAEASAIAGLLRWLQRRAKSRHAGIASHQETPQSTEESCVGLLCLFMLFVFSSKIQLLFTFCDNVNYWLILIPNIIILLLQICVCVYTLDAISFLQRYNNTHTHKSLCAYLHRML